MRRLLAANYLISVPFLRSSGEIVLYLGYDADSVLSSISFPPLRAFVRDLLGKNALSRYETIRYETQYDRAQEDVAGYVLIGRTRLLIIVYPPPRRLHVTQNIQRKAFHWNSRKVSLSPIFQVPSRRTSDTSSSPFCCRGCTAPVPKMPCVL